jgi:hypothetical protein
VFAEIRQPRDQPSHREARTDPDGQDPDAGGRGDLRGQARQRVEYRRQSALIGAPRLCHHQAVGLALEQRDAEPLFQKMHHPGDRRRRHVEFETGAGKTAAARRRLERLDAVEKQQPSHAPPSGKLVPGQHKPRSGAIASDHIDGMRDAGIDFMSSMR